MTPSRNVVQRSVTLQEAYSNTVPLGPASKANKRSPVLARAFSEPPHGDQRVGVKLTPSEDT
jgi:hypothetical protein